MNCSDILKAASLLLKLVEKLAEDADPVSGRKEIAETMSSSRPKVVEKTVSRKVKESFLDPKAKGIEFVLNPESKSC